MKQHFIPALMALAAVFSLTQCETPAGGGGGGQKMGGQTFTNTVGMKLVPVPGTNISMGTTEVTVAQWRASGLPYQSPQFAQGENHPAVNISWNDAQKYCRWLSKKEGRLYRLPTDHEWSCAVGIGHLEDPNATPEQKSGLIKNIFPWGSGRPTGRAGNYRGEECRADGSATTCIAGSNDGYVNTAPVGSYSPNKLGLYDLGGNVWEWCQDKYSLGSGKHALRGTSYLHAESLFLLSSYRREYTQGYRTDNVGFRVVCE